MIARHLSERQLIEIYYGEHPGDGRDHLAGCATCRTAYHDLARFLDETRAASVPEPSAAFETKIWARIAPDARQALERPARTPRRWMWALIPALAGILLLAFLLRPHPSIPPATAFSAEARERVFLITLGDHLLRSQAVLAEIAEDSPTPLNLADQRAQAQDLLRDNRLLRQFAQGRRDPAGAVVLDDLERVLVEVSHTPAGASRADLEDLRAQIQRRNLLFKVAVAGANTRQKGMNL